MEFLDVTIPSFPENLALDEALLLAAEAGRSGEVLRVWEWPWPAVVLGAGGRIVDDVDVAACQAGGVPLARRASGGGTVLLGPGCLLYTVVLRYDLAAELRDIRKSYQWILARIVQELPGLAVAGGSDLTCDGRKVGGSAQQRKRDHLLHHGTLLYGFDVSLIGRYLREPPRQPDYRERRPHAEFVTNLNLVRPVLIERLRAAWAANISGQPPASEVIGERMTEKFGRSDWVHRL